MLYFIAFVLILIFFFLKRTYFAILQNWSSWIIKMKVASNGWITSVLRIETDTLACSPHGKQASSLIIDDEKFISRDKDHMPQASQHGENLFSSIYPGLSMGNYHEHLYKHPFLNMQHQELLIYFFDPALHFIYTLLVYFSGP